MSTRTFSGDVAAGRPAAGRVVVACVLWALVRSALAFKGAKGLASRLAGTRQRNGL